MRMSRLAAVVLTAAGLLVSGAGSGSAQGVPPIPTDVPVWMVGHASIDGRRLAEYDSVTFAMGGTDKEGPLGTGERIEARATQTMSLKPEERDGRAVWVRKVETRLANDGTVVAQAEIVLDRRTLLPLNSSVQQGGGSMSFDYDWTTYDVRSEGADPEALDMKVLEAGAHETWIAAIPWADGMRVMIPTILAGGGGKWWAVPSVTGSEDVDLGDGVRRATWVVEMDWWGMGADEAVFTPGGGANGSAGAGGKYWVLKEPLAGMPTVVRIQTEQDASVDRVTQIQGN